MNFLLQDCCITGSKEFTVWKQRSQKTKKWSNSIVAEARKKQGEKKANENLQQVWKTQHLDESKQRKYEPKETLRRNRWKPHCDGNFAATLNMKAWFDNCRWKIRRLQFSIFLTFWASKRASRNHESRKRNSSGATHFRRGRENRRKFL